MKVFDPGIELGDSVCDFEKVPPDQLCPSAKIGCQVHKASSADPCSYARVSRLCIDALRSPGEMFRDRFIDVDFRTSTIHDAQSQCGSNAVVGTEPRYGVGNRQ